MRTVVLIIVMMRAAQMVKTIDLMTTKKQVNPERAREIESKVESITERPVTLSGELMKAASIPQFNFSLVLTPPGESTGRFRSPSENSPRIHFVNNTVSSILYSFYEC